MSRTKQGKTFNQFLADRLINDLAPLCKKHGIDIKDCPIAPEVFAKFCLILYTSKFCDYYIPNQKKLLETYFEKCHNSLSKKKSC